jgi:hypothetical protein
MHNLKSVVIVLFNPPLSCIEQVLEFLSGFDNTKAKLHILNDKDDKTDMAKGKDLLVLELRLPANLSTLIMKYLNRLYPSVNTFLFDKTKCNTNSSATALPLKSQSFYLN